MQYYFPNNIPQAAGAYRAQGSGQSDVRYTIRSMPILNRTLKVHKIPYKFEKELGRGGFGTVYAARRERDQKRVAIKVMSLATMNPGAAQAMMESILTEIRMSKRLKQSSEHIIEMYDFDFHSHTGLAFIVMELGQQNLEQALQQRGHLSPAERKVLWRQLTVIAMILHNNNIVHLDIKPQNLVVFPSQHIKLIDMGIAQKADTRRNGPYGTPMYSAPEVTQPWSAGGTKNTTKADSWSWGAILYRVVYSRPPTYNEPCYVPPTGSAPTQDLSLIDVLRHTLVRDLAHRVSPPWLSGHPYTLK